MALLVATGLAYLMGSIPFGLLIGRSVYGVDIRQSGSGNIGATNVSRVLGKKIGFLCLLLDALKGLLPTWLLPIWFAIDEPRTGVTAILSGTAAVLGHCFPVWLGFRGGKGVATGAGVATVLSPVAFAVAVAVFLGVLAMSRIVAIASMLAAIGYAVVVIVLLKTPLAPEHLAMTTFAVSIAALIVIRHRSNIVRLMRGEELKVDGQSVAQPQGPTDSK